MDPISSWKSVKNSEIIQEAENFSLSSTLRLDTHYFYLCKPLKIYVQTNLNSVCTFCMMWSSSQGPGPSVNPPIA